ncbi:MAG: PRC-barrel domain-containing protein [Hyphomicrobium sp.]|nr:PRC-barrel domain-containing protein [Hyphomicrobium sp.]
MNKLIVGAALLVMTAAPAFAQGTAPAGVFINAQTAEEYLAKDHLIGMKVQGPDGKIIGDIEDLIVTDGNTVVGIVMGTGGFLGMGEKQVGVALSALKFGEDGGKLVVSLPEGTAENIAAVEPFQRQQPKKSLLERAKEKAKELSDKTSATTNKALEDAKPMLDEASKKAQEAYEAAKEAAGPAYEKAKEAVGTAIEAAKDAAKPAETPAPAAPEAAPAAPAPAPTP